MENGAFVAAAPGRRLNASKLVVMKNFRTFNAAF